MPGKAEKKRREFSRRTDDPTTCNLFARAMPLALFRQWKAMLALKGIKIREALIDYMREYVKRDL